MATFSTGYQPVNTLEVREALQQFEDIIGGGDAGGAVAVVDTVLTNAQIKLLRATPVELVADPGDGEALILESVELLLNAGTAYTESADNLVIEYEDGTDILTVETTGFLDQTTAQRRFMQAEQVTVVNPIASSGIQIKNSGDGEFGGGNTDRTLTVRCRYRNGIAAA